MTPSNNGRGGKTPKSQQKDKRQLFDEHLPLDALKQLLAQQPHKYLAAPIRLNKRNRNESFVTPPAAFKLPGFEDSKSQPDILIPGAKLRNRALEGDVVVIELLSGDELAREERRREDTKREKDIQEDRRNDKARGQGVAEDDSDSEYSDLDDPVSPPPSPMRVPLADRPEFKNPLAKVVGIMERVGDRHPYAGMVVLDPFEEEGVEKKVEEKKGGNGKGKGKPVGKKEFPRLVWFRPVGFSRERVSVPSYCKALTANALRNPQTDKRVPLLAIPSEDLAPDQLRSLIDGVPPSVSPDPRTTLYTATLSRWPASSRHPFGRLGGPLGQVGELEVESKALLVDNDVRTEPFSDEVLACLPATPWIIPEEEIAKRWDLRSERIFSIDPPTAKDLDDAVSIKKIGEDEYELGVHIADVSYFVPEGSALDTEARLRATTVYLTQRAIPMLPALLCEELCSLNPGVDRLAFSVKWIVDSKGNAKEKPRFSRSVIRSCAKLAYGDAQEVIEGRDWNQGYYSLETMKHRPAPEVEAPHTRDQVAEDIRLLWTIAQELRRKRHEGGALWMQNIKLWFALDSLGNPGGVGVYVSREANKLIEEFMLLANMAVAQQLAATFPEHALLRNHGPPQQKSMTKFLELAARLGYPMNANSAGELQASFDAIPDENVRLTLRLMCIKPMQRAKYFCTGCLDLEHWGHYALNVPLYTHFTSPIRRYADLIVHRELDTGLKEAAWKMTSEEVQDIAENCNRRKGGFTKRGIVFA